MMHVIYMAAGNSRRFGRNKLLVSWHGKPLYRHTLDLLLDRQRAWAGRCPITITVVTQYEEILRELGDRSGQEGLSVVYCADSKKGVSYTIRAGIQAVSRRAGSRSRLRGETSQDMWMFVVADQPLLSAASIDALIQAVCDAGDPGDHWEQAEECAPVYEKQFFPEAYVLACHGQTGNPCVFSDALIPELLALEGDQGGRTVLRRHRCMYVEIGDAAEFMDIDSAEDAGRIGGMTDVDGNMAL